MVVFLFGPCTWEPGRGVPGCRGGPRPLVVLVFGLIHRDFHWNGPIFRFTFSPAQWASPQLNGPVQLSSDRDSWLTGPYWPIGRRRKKKGRSRRQITWPEWYDMCRTLPHSQPIGLVQSAYVTTCCSWWMSSVICLNFHQDVSRFTMHKGLRPNSRILYRFFTSHQPMMNEQDQVTWTNWPASKKKSLCD